MKQFESLTPTITREDSELRHELWRLVRKNRQLYKKEGKLLDMQGWNAANIVLNQAYLDNVVKVPDGETHLRIPDVTLYPRPDFSPLGMYSYFILKFQRRNMRKFGMKFPG